MVVDSDPVIDPLAFHGLAALRWLDHIGPGRYRTNRALSFLLPAGFPDAEIADDPDVRIEKGVLQIAPKFETDGASGPAIDGVGNMLAALIHDALYKLRRGGAKGFSYAQADRFYRSISIAQGAGRPRAWLHWTILRGFGWAWRLLG